MAKKREIALDLKIVSILFFILALAVLIKTIIFVGFGLGLISFFGLGKMNFGFIQIFFSILSLGFSAFLLIAGINLLKLKRWARDYSIYVLFFVFLVFSFIILSLKYNPALILNSRLIAAYATIIFNFQIISYSFILYLVLALYLIFRRVKWR